MSVYTNTAGLSLSMAVFLATDHYDYDENTISATALLKPLRQLILAARVPPSEARVDVADMVASRMGTAIHDGIERAWLNHHATALRDLGYPNGVIQRVRINPDPAEVTENDIAVYLEQRSYKEFMGFTISGKFDFVAEGRLEDFKSTSVFTWINNTNDIKHQMQGSLYRWLDPVRITQPEMAIQYIFTDWSAAQARSNPKYPQKRVMERRLDLLPPSTVEAFVRQKLISFTSFKDKPESELPLCNDEDLWRKEPVFKYYKNPAKTTRSTKNYDTYQDAQLHLIQDGNVGIVKEVPGGVTACKYCPAFSACTQKDRLIEAGDLIL